MESNFAKYGRDGFAESFDCFHDVKKEWFAPHACFAKKTGILQGSNGYFYPDKKVTLPEAVKIMTNAHLFFNDNPMLQDAKEEWFMPYLNFMIEKRALPNGFNDVKRNTSRASTAEMLYRLQNNIADKKTGIIFKAQHVSQWYASFFSWGYSVDEENEIYFLDKKLGVKLESFQYIGGRYGKDDQYLYAGEKQIDFIDPHTFQMLDYGFAKDKNGIYIYVDVSKDLLNKIDIQDPDTFVVCERYYGEDQYYGYNFYGARFQKGQLPCEKGPFISRFQPLTSKALHLTFDVPFPDCKEEEYITDGKETIVDFIPRGRKTEIFCDANKFWITAVSKDWTQYEGYLVSPHEFPDPKKAIDDCVNSTEMHCKYYEIFSVHFGKIPVFIADTSSIFDSGGSYWLWAYIPLQNNPYYEVAKVSMRIGKLPDYSDENYEVTVENYLQNVLEKKLNLQDSQIVKDFETILMSMKESAKL